MEERMHRNRNPGLPTNHPPTTVDSSRHTFTFYFTFPLLFVKWAPSCVIFLALSFIKDAYAIVMPLEEDDCHCCCCCFCSACFPFQKRETNKWNRFTTATTTVFKQELPTTTTTTASRLPKKPFVGQVNSARQVFFRWGNPDFIFGRVVCACFSFTRPYAACILYLTHITFFLTLLSPRLDLDLDSGIENLSAT